MNSAYPDRYGRKEKQVHSIIFALNLAWLWTNVQLLSQKVQRKWTFIWPRAAKRCQIS